MDHKLIYLARRSPAVAPEDFGAHWIAHAKFAGTLGSSFSAAFRRVCQCLKVDAPGLPSAYAHDYDGTNLISMVSAEAADAIQGNAETMAVLLEDELRHFSGPIMDSTMRGDEVYRDDPGKSGDWVLLGFHYRRPGTADEALDAALQDYGRAATALGLSLRVVVNRMSHVPGPDYDYAAITELWFDSQDAAVAAARAAEVQALDQRLAAVTDPSRHLAMLSRINLQKPAAA